MSSKEILGAMMATKTPLRIIAFALIISLPITANAAGMDGQFQCFNHPLLYTCPDAPSLEDTFFTLPINPSINTPITGSSIGIRRDENFCPPPIADAANSILQWSRDPNFHNAVGQFISPLCLPGSSNGNPCCTLGWNYNVPLPENGDLIHIRVIDQYAFHTFSAPPASPPI